MSIGATTKRGQALITPELRKKIESCHSLPSPPGVATKIIELANDPEVDIARIADVLALDPAITAKILRIANSPMYARQRKTENLKQALMVIGLNATISLALSFSLLKSWQVVRSSGRPRLSTLLAPRVARSDGEPRACARHRHQGRRGAVSRVPHPGHRCHGARSCRARISTRASVREQGRQAALIEREQERLGVDHAAVSGWLLEKWQFPERTQQVVAASHDPDQLDKQSANAVFARCVNLASMIASCSSTRAARAASRELAQRAQAYFEIDKEGLGELLAEIGRMIPDAESIFETEILSGDALGDDSCRGARSSDAAQPASAARRRSAEDQRRVARRAHAAPRGIEQARSADEPVQPHVSRHYLKDAFQLSNKSDTPLSIAFADLDKFKSVNDTYGHAMGDQILVTTANILKANVRGADVVARYGGEEFILVFPHTEYPLLKTICERIVRAFRETRHDVGTKRDLNVTISIGMATHNDGRQFKSVEELLKAADKALYTAKLQGRNRSVPFDLVANSQLAYM